MTDRWNGPLCVFLVAALLLAGCGPVTLVAGGAKAFESDPPVDTLQPRVEAVQIELNRALYVDEQTSEIKKDDFAALQRVLDQLVTKLGELMKSEAQFATG